MLRILGNPKRACDGLTRRELLIAGGLGLLGSSVLQSSSQSAMAAAAPEALPRKAKSVICLFLFGGWSQLDTFDMKPRAAAEVRGPYKPISTSVPGLHICEHLPRLAQRMDRVALVRSLTSRDANHNTSLILSGHDAKVGGTAIKGSNPGIPFDWPFFMSALQHLEHRAGRDCSADVPANMCVPNQLGLLEGYNRTGPYGGFLGSRYDPVCTQFGTPGEHLYEPGGVRPDALRFVPSGASLGPQMTLDQLHVRKGLLDQLDTARRDLADAAAVTDYGRLQQKALRMLTSDKMRQALDLNREPAAARDRYGWNLFGQSVLLSRRLVEAGVPLVTAIWDCTQESKDISLLSWDTHWDHFKASKGWLLPGLDQALSALLDDLEQRGMLDETLVICLSEMGRTPRINSQSGRDHWVGAYNALLAGAGIQKGAVHGATDKLAAHVTQAPVSPQDLLATVYHVMGFGPETMIYDRLQRPLPLYGDGHPIRGLIV